MSGIETQQGKLRPRVPRKDRLPRSQAAELAAPYRDPHTGRFGAGNPGGRLRQVAALGRAEAESLLRLPLESVAPWLRGHLQAAQQHAQALVDALPAASAELVALCGDEAKARLLANAALTEGARDGISTDDARAWREEARAWLKEARQTVLTRKGVARDTPKPASSETPWLVSKDAAE